jgi:hypothetical protein
VVHASQYASICLHVKNLKYAFGEQPWVGAMMKGKFGPRAFRWMLNFWPCYRGTDGWVTFIAKDWREIRVQLCSWRIKTMHQVQSFYLSCFHPRSSQAIIRRSLHPSVSKPYHHPGHRCAHWAIAGLLVDNL